MRPQRIQVSSSRCDRLEEAEELDTSDEPLLRREPLIDLMDLESASSNLSIEEMLLSYVLYVIYISRHQQLVTCFAPPVWPAARVHLDLGSLSPQVMLLGLRVTYPGKMSLD